MKNKSRLYVDKLSLSNKLLRAIWQFVTLFLFRFTPEKGFNSWRIFLLRLFGARIGKHCRVSSSCTVWAPWNLELDNFVALAKGVDCYNVSLIQLKSYSTVSQRSFLCSASHDISSLARPLVHSPIIISEHAWICAEAFIGPGVTIGEGSIIGARTVVMKNVPNWVVMAGNPAQFIKKRVIAD